jgi:hypothetical protein
MTEDYLKSMKVTIDFWAEDFKLTPFGMITCTDLPKEGAVMQDENVIIRWSFCQGKARRAAGIAYQCHLSGGKHSCVEKDIEVVPMQKLVTVLPEDTFGISKVLLDYVVETTVHRVGQSSTKVEISHYYSTPTLKAKLLNLIARRKIARDTQATLNGMKAAIEDTGGGQ